MRAARLARPGRAAPPRPPPGRKLMAPSLGLSSCGPQHRRGPASRPAPRSGRAAAHSGSCRRRARTTVDAGRVRGARAPPDRRARRRSRGSSPPGRPGRRRAAAARRAPAAAAADRAPTAPPTRSIGNGSEHRPGRRPASASSSIAAWPSYCDSGAAEHRAAASNSRPIDDASGALRRARELRRADRRARRGVDCASAGCDRRRERRRRARRSPRRRATARGSRGRRRGAGRSAGAPRAGSPRGRPPAPRRPRRGRPRRSPCRRRRARRAGSVTPCSARTAAMCAWWCCTPIARQPQLLARQRVER